MANKGWAVATTKEVVNRTYGTLAGKALMEVS